MVDVGICVFCLINQRPTTQMNSVQNEKRSNMGELQNGPCCKFLLHLY